MDKFNISINIKNIMQRVATLDLEKQSILIGRITSIRMYELLYILEMEFEKYYKFTDPRLLQGIYVAEVLRHFLEEKEILYLVHGNVYYYICIKDGHYVGIVDGSSIIEISQNDILETLLDIC